MQSNRFTSQLKFLSTQVSRFGWQWLAALVMVVIASVGAYHVTNAQTRQCRDIDLVTICFDKEDTSPGEVFNPARPISRYEGNVTIARKGQAPFLKVVKQDSVPEDTFFVLHVKDGQPLNRTQFTVMVRGALQIIGDPSNKPIMRTLQIRICGDNNTGSVLEGFFKLDTFNAKLILPDPAEFRSDVASVCPAAVRKPNGFALDFLETAGLLPFFKDAKMADNLAASTFEFDLTARKFNTVIPLELNLQEEADNVATLINVRATIDDKGKFSGSIDGFKHFNGGTGMIWDVSGVTLTGKTATAPAVFEAASVKVLGADNPNVPSFDPNDSTLVFEFSKLRYSDRKWSIGGAEVAIRDLKFGGAFKMTQNRLGFTSQTIDGVPVQSLQIRSTLVFNDSPDSVKPQVEVRIGRTIVNGGRPAPIFEAGLANLTTEVGIFKAKLTNAVFIGNTLENFWGIRAESAALQWPDYAGGRTAAGIQNFKMGIDNGKKLQFGLGSGTINLPEMENDLFKGSFGGTVGTISNTVVFTLTGNLGVKLPGNSGLGIGATAIIRHGESVTPNDPTGALAAAQAAQIRAASPTATVCRNPAGQVIACTGGSNPPAKIRQFELKLSGFDIKVAGFKFAVQNPRGLDDGGFAVDEATLALPIGLNFANNNTAGITVQGLVIDGKGKVTLTGGAIELPSLAIGSLQFVGLKGGFLKTPEGNHEFIAGGKFPMPGLDSGVSVEVRLRADLNTGDFKGAGASVFFQTVPTKGIRIGSTGMELTGMGGSFDVNNGTVKITVQMRASTLAFIPVINLPMVTIDGSASAQFNPFKLEVNASIKLLIIQLAQASVQVGHQAGFNNGDGMNFTAGINGLVMNGNIEFRTGKITVGNTTTNAAVAESRFALGIKKNTFGFLPRRDLTLAGITATGGMFKDKRQSPHRIIAGLKADVEVVGVDFGVFFDLTKTPGGGDFINIRNIDKIVRIDAATLQAARAAALVSPSSLAGASTTVSNIEGGMLEFTSRPLTAEEISAAGIVLAAAEIDGGEQILQERFTRAVTQTTKLAIGIFYPAGAPLLKLQLPDGSVIDETVTNHKNVSFERTVYPDDGSADALFVINRAEIGNYTVIIDNAPVSYEANLIYLNAKPTLQITNIACQGAGVAGVKVTCSAGNAGNSSEVAVNWNSADVDNPEAIVRVGYAVVTDTVAAPGSTDEVNPAELTDANLIAANATDFIPLSLELPVGNGSFIWKLGEVPTGKYKLGVQIDDGVNLPLTVYSNLIIEVEDKRAPAVPTGLVAIPQAGEMVVNWKQNREADLSGYMIGFGLVNDPSQFVYMRNMGAKEVMTGTNNIVDAKIWGLQDNTTIFYSLRAYDISGNVSEWTPLQSAKPWALAPNSWTPAPNGEGSTVVEVAFDSPLKRETIENALVVVDANGAAVAGEFYLLSDLEGNKVMGVGFQPSSPLTGDFTATLKGGTAGVQSTDGRTMGGDYAWSFWLAAPATTGSTVFLPIVSR